MPALALLALSRIVLGWAATDACPAHLFVIERSKNANIVVYDANRGPAGDLESSEPVVVYWLLNGQSDKREDLTRVQRDRAYGVEATPGDSPGTYSLVFKADGKRRLTVCTLNGCPVATTPINNRNGTLRRLFVQSKEDSVLPKVEYIEFFGESVDTGEPLYEKFVPGK
jgi:Domain of unknown function (DUF4833)